MSDDGGGGGGGGGGFEDWDADFLDELIQVEELALSSSSVPNPTPNPNSLVHPRATTAAINVSYLPSLPPPPKQQQQPQPYPSDFVSYSPPRELSQRPISVDFYDNNSNAAATATSSLLDESEKDREIDRLKRELGRVSKHLADRERECFHLKKVTSRREESIQSHAQQTHPTFKDYGATAEDSRGILQKSKNAEALDDRIGRQIDIATSSSTAIGVQTEKDLNNDLPSFSASKKLQDIWGFTSDPLLGGNLISKLFVSCPSDFHVLFGCMDLNMPSKLQVDSLRRSSSDTAMQCRNSFHTAEATKVSNFYSALVKISNGLLQLDDFFETLFDLCNIKNVAILSSSLHVLQVFLKHLLTFGSTSTGRDNVEVEGVSSGNSIKGSDLFNLGGNEASYLSNGPFCISKPKFRYKRASLDIELVSGNWISLFELMHRIAITNTEERIRFEAVSIMNLIVMRSNAYTDREKFGKETVFESLAELLKKDAGMTVRKEALRLLFLLLNCPPLLSLFCSRCKEQQIPDSAKHEKHSSTSKGFNSILESLAGCFACVGNSVQDMELRKRAMILLAYIASSGKSGFEVMVSSKLPGESNFVMLILQVLVSEMDTEASVFTESSESNKARTLLIREGLILLNRLVSSPAYSATVLRVLTASRDMASLTIDVATRLSRKDCSIVRHSDSITRQMRESEIVDLAHIFKRRVFTYLGDKLQY